MAENLRKGDRVSWKSHDGRATGVVVRKLTAPTQIKSHHVAASADDPQYLVESDNGGRAAHKPTALRRITAS